MNRRTLLARAGMTRRASAAAAFIVTALAGKSALAGGYDLPDQGTEALGRGGAFVAKASDGTALYYNPAGLARQRGTNLLVNGNLYFHSFEFQRLGVYPDDPSDTDTPWGDTQYPVVTNVPQMNVAPMLALTTDFGFFDRFTLAAGIYAPSSVMQRTLPLSLAGGQTPSPSRYDFIQSRSSTWFPTLAAGLRATKWLDIGISGHLVLSNIDQTMVTYSDFGVASCRDNTIDGVRLGEDFRCDTELEVKGNGTSFAFTLGGLLRPTRSFALGVSFRLPTNVSASGTVTPNPPRNAPNGENFRAGPMTYAYQLPWLVRFGGRYVRMDRDFELYDLELDATYEGWGSAQSLGPIMTIRDLGTAKDIQSVILHGYRNTLGLRGGGSYNIEVGSGALAIRGGAFFDSSATSFETTRLDYDTLPKVAGTFGVGYKIGAFSFNAAYAAVASIPRTVGTGIGTIRPINVIDGGSTNGSDGAPLASVNDGIYRGFTHILSFGAGITFDSLFGPPRKILYGNSYEPNYAGPRDPDDEPPPPPVTTENVPEPVAKPAEPKPVESPAAVEGSKPAEPKPIEAPRPIEPTPVEPPKPAAVAPEPPPAKAPPPEPEVKPAPPPKVIAPVPAPPPPRRERKPPSKRDEWWEGPG